MTNRYGDYKLPLGPISNSDLEHFIQQGHIVLSSHTDTASVVQPASLDLSLSNRAYVLEASCLPLGERVRDMARTEASEVIDLTRGAIFRPGIVYLVPLQERLNLPSEIFARASPKSSIGRLDVFTRVICDYGTRFDQVPNGYEGELFLEVAPRSFAIRVEAGVCLSQLRLFNGRSLSLTDIELAHIHATDPLAYSDLSDDIEFDNGLPLKINLMTTRGQAVGYKAKRHAPPVDLTGKKKNIISTYWEPIYQNAACRLTLYPEDLYILRSVERVRVHPNLSAEMAAYEVMSGELRSHYAGFFDPGFGYSEFNRLSGGAAVMEVRAHDVPFTVQHGQRVSRLTFERIATLPTKLYGSRHSSYQAQGLKLSKYFTD